MRDRVVHPEDLMAHLNARLAAIGEHQHGLITHAQLDELGVSPQQRKHLIGSGHLVVVHPGVVRIGGADLAWPQALHAACLATNGSAVASHRAAARLWRLDGLSSPPVEISLPRWSRPGPRTGVRIHESTDLGPVDRCAVNGIPTTTAIRTLIDLGAVVSVLPLETALDDAVRRNLVSLPALRQRFVELARRGRRGIGVLRPLLEARTGDLSGPGSTFETRTLALIRESNLPDPVCQHEVRGPGWVHYLDFAWPEQHVAMECDSLAYHFGRRALQWDDTRQNRLVLLGWTVLRFTWQDLVQRPGRLVAQVRQALTRHLP
jgi:hypothetical protein